MVESITLEKQPDLARQTGVDDIADPTNDEEPDTRMEKCDQEKASHRC